MNTSLDARAERTLAEVTAQLRTLCGERLRCVALYGSGVGADYVADASDLNLVVVLTQVDRDVMIALRGQTPGWRQRRVAAPLVLEQAFLRAAADVFPMELHDIKDTHRLLAGEDVFATLPISDAHLRYQCEHEARGKLLRLRQLYFEVGGDTHRLQDLMLDSLKTFLIIMRAVVRMRDRAGGSSYGQTLAAFRQAFALSLPIMGQLLEIKIGKARWADSAEETFHRYVDEVEQLVRVVDQLKVAD